MFALKTTANSLGLVLTIVGVYLVYVNSPINFHTIDGGNPDTDFNKLKREVEWKNWLLRAGVYVIILGSAVQLVSNYIP